MNLTDAQFELWMQGLRSGLFVQTDNELASKPRIGIDPEDPLRAGVGYCCMGVCGKVCFYLPVTKLVGRSYLTDLTDRRVFALGDPFSEAEQILLGQLNDKCKLTFPQIAAFIEAGGIELCKPQFTEEIHEGTLTEAAREEYD